MSFEIIWRATDRRSIHATNRIFGNKTEVSKKCFNSVRRGFPGANIKVILDKSSEELTDFYREQDVIHVDFGNLPEALSHSYPLACKSKADFVLYAEDDYLYVPTASRQIEAASEIPYKFMHPSDYSDRYREKGECLLYKTKLGYWRSITKSTLTLGGKPKTFAKHHAEFKSMMEAKKGHANGYDAWWNRVLKDNLTISPIPSIAYHLDSAANFPPLNCGMKVNIFMLARDNEGSLHKTLSSFDKLEGDITYYFLENDSIDKTPTLLREFLSNHKGKLLSMSMGKEKWGEVRSKGRIADMADYHNWNKDMCTEWKDFSVIMDTEIAFQSDILEKFSNSLKDAAMVTPWGVNRWGCYYDMFAFKSGPWNPEYDGQWLVEPQGVVEVESAFGGVAAVSNEVMLNCSWGVPSEGNEHVPFCKGAAKYGKVVIDPSIEVVWK